MNLLWIAGWYPHYLEPLGGDFVKRHAEAVSLYHSVQVIFVARDPALPAGTVRIDKKDSGNLKEWIITYNTYWWTGKLGSQLKYRHLYKKYIRQYISEQAQPDLVHFHVAMRTCTIASWIRNGLSLPYVVTEHWTGFLPEAGDQFLHLPAYLRHSWRSMMRKASGIHAVSQYLGQHLKALIGDSVLQIQIIPNTVDTSIFFIEKDQRHQNRFVHVVSGSGPHKNTAHVLQAFAIFSKKNAGYKLDLAGPADARLLALAEQLSIQQEVVFHGEVTQHQLADMYRTANALVIYSRYETFGCVVTEAQCCGTIAIASDIPVTAETVASGKNGLVVSGEQPEKLALMLEQVISNPNQINGKEVSTEATGKYNYKAIGKLFTEWYTKVLSRHQS